MRAVMPSVPEDLLEWRRRTGASRFDEVWDGVLHMVPTPNRDHQDLEGALETWLRTFWASAHGGRVYHQINLTRGDRVGDWQTDYRILDLVLLTPDRFHIDHNAFFAGPPAAVVEIRSPEDETDEKLPFYAAVGVPEVWIVDRDTRAPELHALRAHGYERLAPDADGWLHSATGVQLRRDKAHGLLIRLSADPKACRSLPRLAHP